LADEIGYEFDEIKLGPDEIRADEISYEFDEIKLGLDANQRR
jgi:hypothetical protein